MNELTYYTRSELKKIAAKHNPEHDYTPDARVVSYRELILVDAILELEAICQDLQNQINEMG